jgi:phenylalanyl-tRNA synthetase alpha chain
MLIIMIDQKLADELKKRASNGDAAVLRSPELRSLFDQIKTMPPAERSAYGQRVNALRQELEKTLNEAQDKDEKLPAIDVTAPFDANTPQDKRPKLLPAENGSEHPLMTDQAELLDIFARMGFSAIETRELDDDWHMFTSLNFPEGHPARDDWDTFMTIQKDKEGKPFIAPAHTSTMQNRVLQANKHLLEEGKPIAYVIPGRTFRNEDVDPTHEHTLDQLEGVYVDKEVHAGMLVATLKAFLQAYYGKELDVKINPFYFPFTEPSFELMMSCPFCNKEGCNVCSYSGWIEILGCGMIHPNVLKLAGIDPDVYTGFAWGVGTMRLTMMKHGIEDIRYFNSARLDFLRQFS